jgi:hypothetical protein
VGGKYSRVLSPVAADAVAVVLALGSLRHRGDDSCLRHAVQRTAAMRKRRISSVSAASNSRS